MQSISILLTQSLTLLRSFTQTTTLCSMVTTILMTYDAPRYFRLVISREVAGFNTLSDVLKRLDFRWIKYRLLKVL